MIIGITDRQLAKTEEDHLKKTVSYLKHPEISRLILREPDMNETDYELWLNKVLEKSPDLWDKIIVHTHKHLAEKYNINRLHLPERLGYRIPELKDQFHLSVSFHPTEETPMPDASQLSALDFLMISPVCLTACKPGATPIPRNLLLPYLSVNTTKVVLLGGLNDRHVLKLKSYGFKHFAYRSNLGKY